MSVLAIDPGPQRSAWLLHEHGRPTRFDIVSNDELLAVLAAESAGVLAVESVASYGMAVGAEVFETCVWTGRFIQRWTDTTGGPVLRVYRRDVKMHLCANNRAKDANVRQALIDLYGPGKDKAIGLKANPGPLYGVKSHIWAALAVAVTAAATLCEDIAA